MNSTQLQWIPYTTKRQVSCTPCDDNYYAGAATLRDQERRRPSLREDRALRRLRLIVSVVEACTSCNGSYRDPIPMAEVMNIRGVTLNQWMT